PTLLAAGAIHHHLIGKGLRTLTSLLVEAGDVRETHHFATLIGFGVDAINPYLTYATLAGLYKEGAFHKEDGSGENEVSLNDVIKFYSGAVEKRIIKIMSKYGISTVQSYQVAQIFKILGLKQRVVDKCFKEALSRIEGIGFAELSV